jgi:hypothetical protein
MREVFAFSPVTLQFLHCDRVGFAHKERDFTVLPVALQVPAIHALDIPIAVTFINHEKSTCSVSTDEATRMPKELFQK